MPAPVLMPVPSAADYHDGRLPVGADLRVAIEGADEPRLRAAIARWLTAWQNRTGITFPHTPAGAYAIATAGDASIVIRCTTTAPALPMLGEDESYTLDITDRQARLVAPTTTGALRGLATLTQLLQGDAAGWFLPAVAISDAPRFPWRGLMIDVCRHWQPIEVIERNLDGMALVKLNVLHLHLTEDQGFRIESKTVPRLHELGSDGHYFTQDQIRAIIAYAAARGIRVVPEFDLPGHATSWVTALPEIASAPGPYVIERRWGVFDPVLDPTHEQTYAVLERFLGEMAVLFPDPYLHIGGDENNGVQWNANPRIQAFIREHQLKDNAGLHAYFNRRVRDILRRHGKKMVGWDEILHPDLPQDSIIHSWRGATGLAAAAHQGYQAILSNGYYIDLNQSAADHYRNDPIPADTTLTADEQRRILGGEATMWTEWTTPEIIDSRIWPRTAAIAERLWSPRTVVDIADMYRRLGIISRRIEDAGLQHESNRPAMICRFAGDGASSQLVAALTTLVDLIEPVKGYQRGAQQPSITQLSPLTGLADCARPESETARKFGDLVSRLAKAPRGSQPAEADEVRQQLLGWRAAAEQIITEAASASPRVKQEGVPIASALAAVCTAGLDLVAANPAERTKGAAMAPATLEANKRPGFGIELPIADALAGLLPPAGAPAGR